MLLLAVCLAGLAPGITTALLLRRHGWLPAAAAGLGVTLALPGLLLLALIAMPPLAYLLAVCSVIIAARAFDEGRVWVGCAWAIVLATALACAGVR
ncbi:hypothetical protein [Streptomyces sp. SID5910]|uniref:hypothetical protein n=1 Tax=Streptomyces sp. SID5910 TaxID=2690312 RepID=UPI00136B6C48|nr:hypothetical protein [Streptomyces sp. SID5910]MYR45068.1 hypothetical protein [Streptomyces sp. SID5910]